jgi:hypothetical protein
VIARIMASPLVSGDWFQIIIARPKKSVNPFS